MTEKKSSTFSKITKVVVWIMLIVTIGGVLLATGASLLNLYSF